MNRAIGTRIDRCGVGMILMISLLLGVVVARVVQLQLAPDPRLMTYVGDHSAGQIVPALRGDVVDRRGRLLASTRFGSRAFVDPLRLPDPPDEVIVELARIIDLDPGPIGRRIADAISHNRRILDARSSVQTIGPKTDAQVRAELISIIKARFARSNQPPPHDPPDPTPSLRRYVRVSGVLSDEQIAAVRAIDAPGVHLERATVREYTAAHLAASIVGKVGFDGGGLLGAELLMDDRLTGIDGRVRYVRDAYGRPLWIEVGDYVPADPGRDVQLSIDIELQRIAADELNRGVQRADAAGGRLVMLDPDSGQILAMVDVVRHLPDAVPFQWEDRDSPRQRSAQTPRQRYITLKPDPARDIHPALARNRCVEDVYEPGSTFKAIVWASITDLDLADPNELIQTHSGAWRTPYGRRIEDVNNHVQLTWFDVLVNSSNIGMSKVAARADFRQLHDAVRRFGFGRKTGIGLPGETAGIVTSLGDWTQWTQTSVSFGYEVAVTPVQMVRAYAAFARPGDRAGTIPDRLDLVASPDSPRPRDIRVLSPEVARLTREAMLQVGRRLDQTIRTFHYDDQPFSYTLFGKSGTARIPLGAPPKGTRAPPGYKGYFQHQYTTSFIAGAPADEPRIIVIVIIDDPGPALVRANRYYGSHVAGPIVRRVVERSLAYMGVEPSPGMGPAAN